MKNNVEVLEDNKVKITVTVESDEVNKRIKQEYKSIAKKYKFPGFRPGRAPRPVIDATYGKETILAIVAEDVINDFYPVALDDCGHATLGKPKFENDDEVKENEDYTFSFTVDKKPEFELSSYDAVEIKMPPSGATESEIDNQIETLTKYYVKWEDARANTTVKKDSHVKVTLSATADGEDVEEAHREDYPYTLGTTLWPQGFDDQLLGMKKGAKKTFEIDLVDDDTAGLLLSDYKGKKVTFDVEINSVMREVAPKVTDEWVKETLSYENVADLRQKIADEIVATKETQLPDLKESRCLDVMRERLEGEPPASFCDSTEVSLLQDFYTQLQRQGTTLDSYLAMKDMTYEQFKDDVKKQARDIAAEEFAVEAWARKYNIEATQAELTEEFENAGVEDANAAMDTWRKEGRLHEVREALTRKKAMEDIMDKAKVTEETEADKKAAKKAGANDGKAAAAKKSSAKDAKDTKTSAKKPAAKKPATKKTTTKKATTTKKTTATKTTTTKKATTKKEETK